MANAAQEEAFEEDYQEYDEFDEDEEDRGLSGFAVLIMGIVMIGAFVSVVWIAYKQGMKVGRDGGAIETPYVAADPEPIKIETAEDGTPVADREVYDALDGEAGDPVTTLAEGPEEPVSRTAEDTIGALAAEAEQAAADVSDEVEDRLASLQAQDAEALDNNPTAEEPRDTAPPTVSVKPSVPAAPASSSSSSTSSGVSAGARSGTHVVQVGAFRSNDEAMAQWGRMQTKLGDFLNGKSPDVEQATVNGTDYHRLRVGPFSSSDAAKAYCADLKERGQDCLIKSL